MNSTVMNSQRLIIRADADASMGTGHVMRCLALAQGWQDYGGEVVFAGRITSAALQQKIKENGCTYMEVKQPFPVSDDFELLRKLIQKAEQTDCPWVVVDGYHFITDYVSRIRRVGAKVMFIDDYAHQPEYLADVLLNQNLGSEGLHYKLNQDAIRLLGSKYALLRSEFLRENNRNNNDVFPKDTKHVLVTLGGADPDNVTLKVIETLNQVDLPHLEVKIVVGPANPYLDVLKKCMDNVSFTGQLLTDVKDMVPLMKWADVAVTAGGSTCWELAYLGVPALLIVLSENQVAVARRIADDGAGLNCGWAHKLQTNKLAERIGGLLQDREQRRLMAESGCRLVDGQGCVRVIEKMRYFPFSFHAIRLEDCQFIYDCVNDPVVRMTSFHSDKIDWDEHEQWFRNKLDDKESMFWVVSVQEEKKAGQVRFDLADDSGVISVSLSQEFRHKGLGSELIRRACQKFFDIQAKSRVKAFVKKDNDQSFKAFSQAGFEMVGEGVMHGYPAIVMSLEGC